MPQNDGQEHRGWKEYRELLKGMGISFIVLAVLVAVLSTILYCWNVSTIEQINNRSLKPGWTCFLLGIPIVIQICVFLLLRKRIRQAISNDELRAYFKFYFLRMACSLIWYTVLWLFYVMIFIYDVGYWATQTSSW